MTDQFWVGSGVSTSLVAPVEGLTFSLNRNNIASHSTFAEVLFRLGYVGLFLFAILLSAIWNGFGPARDRLEVQAVASFMLGIFAFVDHVNISFVFCNAA